MFDLITIGDSTIDTFLIIDENIIECDLKKEQKKICFNYADKIPIKKSDQSVGGNAANVAVGATKLGLKTSILTELGDDVGGQTIVDELKNTNVDTKLVKINKNSETNYAVVLNYKSERTILSYHTKRNYTLPKLPKTKWIYYTSLGQNFGKLQTKLLSYLEKNPNIKLAINPGSYQLQQGIKEIKEILPQTDLLFLNKEEAVKILGKKISIKPALKAFIKMGVKKIAITDGTNGSYASDGSNYYFMTTYPIKPIAKTGAGDAYTSGFLVATILEKRTEQAMQWGTANSAGVIQKVGAHKGLLTKTSALRLIKKYPDITPQLT